MADSKDEQMAIEEVKRRAIALGKWAGTDAGHQQLRKDFQQVAAMTAELSKARRVEPSDLESPIAQSNSYMPNDGA